MEMATIPEGEMAVLQEGTGTPPLLLVHGFPLDHSMWKYQIEEFSSDHKVLGPDLRGFGKSSRAGGKLTMEHMADDLAVMLDAVNPRGKLVLCALSMGGYIALEFVRKHANKLKGLILCDTRATADSPEAADGRRAMADRVEKEGVPPVVEAMFPKLITTEFKKAQPTDAEELWHVMMSSHPESVAAALRGMAERKDFADSLGEINLPTLVIVGENDEITPPANSQAMAKAIPNAKLVTIDGAGHMAPLEKPEEVNKAITAFLKNLE